MQNLPSEMNTSTPGYLETVSCGDILFRVGTIDTNPILWVERGGPSPGHPDCYSDRLSRPANHCTIVYLCDVVRIVRLFPYLRQDQNVSPVSYNDYICTNMNQVYSNAL